MSEKDESLRKRFSQRYRVDASGCWLWTGPFRGSNGYGSITTGRSTRLVAHRVAWEIHRGPIPPGLWVLHRCDVPTCVNPDHLFLGTARDNSQDMLRKGRHRTNPVRGAANGRSKLTDGEWLLAGQLYVRGWSARKIGRLFAVTRQSVNAGLKSRGVVRGPLVRMWNGERRAA